MEDKNCKEVRTALDGAEVRTALDGAVCVELMLLNFSRY
jgi:hypothetical protein